MSRGIPEREARKFLTAAQIRKARLTPQAVSILPRSSKYSPEDVLRVWLYERWPEGLESEYTFSARHDYRFDFAWPELRLAVEVDGYQAHAQYRWGKKRVDGTRGAAGWERDRIKDRLAMLDGWRVPRFTAWEIMQDMPMVMATLAALRVVCGATE